MLLRLLLSVILSLRFKGFTKVLNMTSTLEKLLPDKIYLALR